MAYLTKRFIDGLSPDPAKELFIWDSQLPGFGLRVKPSGRVTFIIQYRNGNQSTRRMTLGKYGVVTLDQARKKAAHLLSGVSLEKSDPSAERRSSRGEISLNTLAQRYMREYAMIRKKARSYNEDQRLLDKFILKKIGHRTVKEIEKQDIVKIHTSLSGTPIQANRVVSLLSSMFGLAEQWGERPEGSNPCRYVAKFKERKCERYLTQEELKSIGQTLSAAEQDQSEPLPAIIALRLLILTGARKNEILGLKWEEVDLEAGLLRLADSKTGSKVIYLNQAAIDILENLERTSPWVIASQRKDGPFVGLQKIWERLRVKANVADVRIHDLRHGFASVAVGMGEGLPVIGKLLGHHQITTTQRYAHLADDPIRRANERIGRYPNDALEADSQASNDTQAQIIELGS